MKKRNVIDNLMHFLVHNGFVFTVEVMCLVHVALLIMMLALDLTPLVYFNTLSVIIYIFSFLLCKFGHIMPVYISIIMEVTAYTIYSTYYIGLKCGTYCFLFSIVPIIIYFGCFLFKGLKRIYIALLLALNFGIFVTLYILYGDIAPIYELEPGARLMIVVFSSFVMVFSTIFYNVIYIYSSEVERTGLESKNKQLSEDAMEDALTGLLNRRGFIPIVDSLMKPEGGSHFCIAFCDIDNFKRINDTFGHDAGDEVLRHISGLIRKEMHGCNICRWGGEEMIILMKDYDMAVAKGKMEYLRKSIESTPTVFFNQRIPATITIGVEEKSDKYSKGDDIIKVADERMYYGKQHGKNIVVFEDATD